MQLSGYYSGKVLGPNGSSYFYSEDIPSLSWNHSVLADPSNSSHLNFIKDQAACRHRQPAFFVRESELKHVMLALGDKCSVAREQWMICSRDTLLETPILGELEVRFSKEAVPPDDYCYVLENLFEDNKLNDRFRNFYVPTLKRSTLKAGTSVSHAVGYVEGEPVTCGSVYRAGSFAGLYSVGSIASRQNRGYGRQVSLALSQSALNEGAGDIFLQCVIGNHVERLYSSIGYVSVEKPGLISI